MEEGHAAEAALLYLIGRDARALPEALRPFRLPGWPALSLRGVAWAVSRGPAGQGPRGVLCVATLGTHAAHTHRDETMFLVGRCKCEVRGRQLGPYVRDSVRRRTRIV